MVRGKKYDDDDDDDDEIKMGFCIHPRVCLYMDSLRYFFFVTDIQSNRSVRYIYITFGSKCLKVQFSFWESFNLFFVIKEQDLCHLIPSVDIKSNFFPPGLLSKDLFFSFSILCKIKLKFNLVFAYFMGNYRFLRVRLNKKLRRLNSDISFGRLSIYFTKFLRSILKIYD